MGGIEVGDRVSWTRGVRTMFGYVQEIFEFYGAEKLWVLSNSRRYTVLARDVRRAPFG